MLDQFPAEIPIVYSQKPPVELEGFFSEGEHPAIPPAASAVASTTVARSWRGVIPSLALIAAAVMAAPVLLIRDSQPSAASVARDIILVPSSPAVETSVRAEKALPTAITKTRVSVSGQDRTAVRSDSQPRRASAPAFEKPQEPLSLVANASLLDSASTEGIRVDTASTAASTDEPLAEIPSPTILREDLSDEAAIRGILHLYQAAYERLDAAAAQDIWPSVDQRALATAFAGLETQSITFDACRIAVAVERAIASCHGRATYVGRIGNRTTQTHRHTWTFYLRKSGETWQIDSVQFK